METGQLLRRRERVMGPAYRLFYDEPVHLERGEGVYLYDREGRRYLDCYNNVASVGHCHPRVVAALSRQAALLNTHTRYLHENVVRYAERLAATFPGELSVCMFTCSGSEANELAYRIARAVTGNDGAVVLENAYHGTSKTTFELSPEDYPEDQRPAYVATATAPNDYRGPHRRGEDGLGEHYAGAVDEAIGVLSGNGHAPALFIADGVYSTNGILTPPPAYLRESYRRIRAAGGLAVADEVQSGLYRLGDHCWAFEDSAVVPDIVTAGKPLGDGHPLAVVITTPDIAAAFARRHDYFNTFGGNPVSAAVGNAVLDVIEDEGIQENVRATGHYLGQGLQALCDRHELIGDVRGKGLFYGLELVRDRVGLEPAAEEAIRLRDWLRHRGILLGVTGPQGNVIKIRPPLVFGPEHADELLAKLDEGLACMA
jgi:4-aminobutyrate aminotransferase-like enzyme